MKASITIVLLALLPLLSLNLQAQVTWEGDVDNDWENDDNWDSGLVPDYSEDIVIPVTANDPVLQSAPGLPVECNNLTIDVGVVVTITGDGALNVYGDIDNSGAIIIEDNGLLWQDVASAYTGQVGSSFSLSRTGTSDPLKFNMWSSPVVAQSVAAFSGNAYSFDPFSSTASTADDDDDPGWMTAAGTMTVGHGYACAGCGTVTFSGTPNNGSFSTPVEYHGGPGVPYNLVGNPYPSPLNINSFLNFGSNPTDLVTLAVYLWDNPASEPWDQLDYATVNSAGTVSNGNATYSTPYDVIPTGQGFFVEIDAATDNDLDFNNSVRADGFSDNSRFYKLQAPMQRLWLGVSDADSMLYNEILVAFTDSATTGFDKKYDAKKLVGNRKLSLYTINNNLHFAIQGLPYLGSQEVEVPLGIAVDVSSPVTFALKWEEELEDFDIFLKDHLSGTTLNLRGASYPVALASGEHNTRFSLLFSPKTFTGIADVRNAEVLASYHDGSLHLRNRSTRLIMMDEIAIFDLSGKRLKAWNAVALEANSTMKLNYEPCHSGYYLVNMVTDAKPVRQKVRIID